MRNVGRGTLKILSATIALFILAITLSSCSLFSVDPALAGYKSAPEIVRLLTAAVNDRTQISDSFSAIPERQRGDVSYSYFTQYVDILRTLMRQGGTDKVTSFRILNSDETNEAIGRSGDLGCAQLLFESERQVPLYVVYELDDSGNCKLSFSWISGIINIYNYAQHYFSMLDSRNIEGIYAILRPGFTDNVYTDDVVYAKAAALSDFYMVKVKSQTSQYLITSLTPSRMEITIPRVLDENNDHLITHSVCLDLSGGAYIISDSIDQEPDPLLSYLTDASGNRLLRCGANYSFRGVSNTMGNPMNVSFNSAVIRTEEDTDGSEYEVHKILVNYKGLLLVFEGHGESRRSWEGMLVSIILTPGTDYRLGSGVTAGISQSELLEVYPYLDKLDYQMTFRNTFGNLMSVDFSVDDEHNISRVRVDCRA